SAVGGYMFITKGQGLLPAVSTAPTPIDFGQTMTPNDFVLIKAKDTGGVYKTEYIQVLTLVSGTTYNVTRDVASDHVTDPAWADGTVYVVLGNTGNGRLELNALDTPRLSVIKQGATYNGQTEYIRLGDLAGFLGYPSSPEVYGIAIGEATKYLKYDPTGGLVIAGNITATTGAIGGWTLGATTLSGTNASLSSTGYISFGATPPTSYGNNVGAWIGYSSAAKMSLYTDANRYFQYDGADFTLKGGTITGGTIQTATGTGQRIVIAGATNDLNFYDVSNNNIVKIGKELQGVGTASGLLVTNGQLLSLSNITGSTAIYGYITGSNNIGVYGVATGTTENKGVYGNATGNGVNYGIYGDANGGTTNWAGYFGGAVSIGTASQFIVNVSGQITKINNISPTAKYVPIGAADNSNFSPRLLAMSDLPVVTANRVLLSDASGYVSASSVSNTTLGYLDATSSIQTQINSKQATITGGATSIVSSDLTASKIAVSDASGKVAVSTIASSELFTPAYGELYDNIATSTITTDGTNYVKWTGSTVGETKGVTGNITNDNLTIDTGQGGKYKATYSITFYANTADSYYWTVNVGGSPIGKIRNTIQINDINTNYVISGSAIISLSATNTVDLGCYSTNGRIVTVTYANLNITKVSN
ncbi:MAG: hypothetical protein ABIJ40_14055, partial [Bacteroidota bacterium]